MHSIFPSTHPSVIIIHLIFTRHNLSEEAFVFVAIGSLFHLIVEWTHHLRLEDCDPHQLHVQRLLIRDELCEPIKDFPGNLTGVPAEVPCERDKVQINFKRRG